MCFRLRFYLILTRILDDRTYKEDFNEEFHKLDLSGFLIRGSERVLAYYDAVEIWSASTFDSQLRSFVPGTCKHYPTRNKKYIYSVVSKAIFFFTLLRSGDVHPHPGPRCKPSGDNSVFPRNTDQPNVNKRKPKFPCVTMEKESLRLVRPWTAINALFGHTLNVRAS